LAQICNIDDIYYLTPPISQGVFMVTKPQGGFGLLEAYALIGIVVVGKAYIFQNLYFLSCKTLPVYII
jgi:hypothetical protein